MDPTTICCPNEHCPARGQTGQGNMGIHARKEQRFICPAPAALSRTRRHAWRRGSTGRKGTGCSIRPTSSG